MLKSARTTLSMAALAAVCVVLSAPSVAVAATPAGAVFSPGVLPADVFKSNAVEKVQQRRRARNRRRGARRGRRGARRFRGGRRLFRRGGRRFRGPYLAFPSPAIPYYYNSNPYYDYPSANYDPYYYGGYDYTPTPPPRGGSCARWRRRCQANWGYGNQDFWGCMRYHGCD